MRPRREDTIKRIVSYLKNQNTFEISLMILNSFLEKLEVLPTSWE